MRVFICVITRPFLVFGVFVGLFMGVRRYDFFLGGHFGEIGPFYAHFSPEASKWDFLGSEIFVFGHGGGTRPPSDWLGVRPCSHSHGVGRAGPGRFLVPGGHSFTGIFKCCTGCRLTPTLRC